MNRVVGLWRVLRDGFWFLPSIMAVASILLAMLMIDLDERVSFRDVQQIAWVYRGSADGARAVLSTIASSMVGVAGTTFSITIAALSLASAQMGPRLLAHFTRDRGNQLSLGAFIATFCYSLVVLRSVRGEEAPFIPHLAVTLGLGLSLVCLGVLIYFIHHIANGINVQQVIRLVTNDLEHTIEGHYSTDGDSLPGGLTWPEDFEERSIPLRAPHSGYIQSIDTRALVRLAERHEVLVRLDVRPGDFLFPGGVYGRVYPREVPGLLKTFTVGSRRTSYQDVEYAARELVEIAVRALSPGINDPFTAITCLDHLGAALCHVAEKDSPNAVFGRGGTPRLVLPVTRFEGLLDVMFNQIRQNGTAHPAVMIHMLDVLARIVERFERPERLRAIETHVHLVYEAGTRRGYLERDQEDLEQRYTTLIAKIDARVTSGERRADAPAQRWESTGR